MLMSSMLRIKLALLAGAPVFAAAKKAKQAAAATAATVDDAVDWKSAGLTAAGLLFVTLVFGYMVHRNGEKAAAPAPAAAASARSATVTVPTSTVPAPEPVSPFDEARTRRFKRMFQKYSSDDGTISEVRIITTTRIEAQHRDSYCRASSRNVTNEVQHRELSRRASSSNSHRVARHRATPRVRRNNASHRVARHRATPRVRI
jgi:hypothetical protein